MQTNYGTVGHAISLAACKQQQQQGQHMPGSTRQQFKPHGQLNRRTTLLSSQLHLIQHLMHHTLLQDHQQKQGSASHCAIRSTPVDLLNRQKAAAVKATVQCDAD
jgi:hypothetical protein